MLPTLVFPAPWPQSNSYILPAKFRKIIALDGLKTTHTEVQAPVRSIATKHTTRKTVTITDDDDSRKIMSKCIINKSIYETKDNLIALVVVKVM